MALSYRQREAIKQEQKDERQAYQDELQQMRDDQYNREAVSYGVDNFLDWRAGNVQDTETNLSRKTIEGNPLGIKSGQSLYKAKENAELSPVDLNWREIMPGGDPFVTPNPENVWQEGGATPWNAITGKTSEINPDIIDQTTPYTQGKLKDMYGSDGQKAYNMYKDKQAVDAYNAPLGPAPEMDPTELQRIQDNAQFQEMALTDDPIDYKTPEETKALQSSLYEEWDKEEDMKAGITQRDQELDELQFPTKEKESIYDYVEGREDMKRRAGLERSASQIEGEWDEDAKELMELPGPKGESFSPKVDLINPQDNSLEGRLSRKAENKLKLKIDGPSDKVKDALKPKLPPLDKELDFQNKDIFKGKDKKGSGLKDAIASMEDATENSQIQKGMEMAGNVGDAVGVISSGSDILKGEGDVADYAKVGGKAIEKFGGQSLQKFVPGVGAAVQGGAGLKQLFGKGDWKSKLSGALKVGSSIASFLPGVGTAVSTVANLASTGLDVAASMAKKPIEAGISLAKNFNRSRPSSASVGRGTRSRNIGRRR